jgi:hypothetical protein
MVLRCIFSDKPVYLFCVYMPPSSKHFNFDAAKGVLSDIEQTMDRLCGDGECVVLGDLNAHIGEEEQQFDTVDSFVSLERRLESKKSNPRGRALVTMTSLKRLVILNGVLENSGACTLVPLNTSIEAHTQLSISLLFLTPSTTGSATLLLFLIETHTGSLKMSLPKSQTTL